MLSDVDEAMLRARRRLGVSLRGKYRLDSVLGIGGMAVVYRATHRNGAKYAVKILHPELCTRGDITRRFLREGKAANSIDHAGVVAVVDDDVAEDGSAFLVMELLEGTPVERIWKACEKRIPVRDVLSIASQLLDVLTATHAVGIVHRDIKPPNLFITLDGTLKVLDFGIARVRDVATGQGTHATGTGHLLGTPAFMAPEQALGKSGEVDARTDLWGVGSTLFLLLSGQAVHEGDNGAQIMIRSATTPARPITNVAGDVPPAVARVIDRALSFQRDERWSLAASMREAIEQASIDVFAERTSKGGLAKLVAQCMVEDELLAAADAAREAAGLDALMRVVRGGTVETQNSADEPFTNDWVNPLQNADTQQLSPLAPRGPERRTALLIGSAMAAVAIGSLLLAGGVRSHRNGGESVASPPALPPETSEQIDAGRLAAPELPSAAPQQTVTQGSALFAPTTSTFAAPARPAPASQPRAAGPLPGRSTPSVPRPRDAPTAGHPPPPPAPAPSSSACAIVTTFDSEGEAHFKKVCP